MTIRRRQRCWARDEQGAIAIEFALVFPVFLLMVYGFMELGRMLFLQNMLGHAVYEAQRYAVVHGSIATTPATADTIEAEVVASASALDADLLTVDVTFAPDNAPGSTVTIDATYDFQFMTDLIPGGGFDMTANSVATIAY